MKALEEWFHKKYKEGNNLKYLIDVASKQGWNEREIGNALKEIKLQKEDKHIRKYMKGL